MWSSQLILQLYLAKQERSSNVPWCYLDIKSLCVLEYNGKCVFWVSNNSFCESIIFFMIIQSMGQVIYLCLQLMGSLYILKCTFSGCRLKEHALWKAQYLLWLLSHSAYIIINKSIVKCKKTLLKMPLCFVQTITYNIYLICCSIELLYIGMCV